MANIKVSVLIITYNQDKYIKKTLDSILNQNFNCEFEIIIGDDCSKDETRSIIQQYAAAYPNIIKPLYNLHNLGVIRNYFNVIAHCSGEYIMECAGDDWWLPEKVNKQLSIMESDSRIGLCYGMAECHDENGITLNKYVGAKCCTFEELLICNNIPACTVCFRKSLFDDYVNEIAPESKEWLMEDYPAWLWISKHSVIHFINDNVAAYRISNESASRTKNIEKQLLFEINTWEVKKYFADKYNQKIEIIDTKALKRTLLFEQLKNKYDKKTAKEYKKNMKLNSIKNIVKYILFSYELTFKLYNYLLVKK